MRRGLAWVAGGLGLLVLVGASFAWLQLRQLESWWLTPVATAESVEITVKPGTSLYAVSQSLQAAQLVPQASQFRLYCQYLSDIEDCAKNIQAGHYRFLPSHSPADVARMITQGLVLQYAFRVPEGVTVAVLLERLRAEPSLQQDIASTNAVALAQELNLPHASAEGWLFPDTYQFQLNDSARAVLGRAYAAMQVELEAAWQTADERVRKVIVNPEKLLTLGSIIEKETGRAEDRRLVSQVFHNRLHQGMRLQTDPTVIYGVPDFDGNLTRKHLQTDTPYNSYTRHGLPPTPISTVSAASLAAAAQPEAGSFLYFVARGDGTTQFSETLSQHNQAVRQYQLRSR